jgi:argininosuccinate lyase
MRALAGPGRCRGQLGDARLHAFAGCAAGDLGPPHDGLCRDVRRDLSRVRDARTRMNESPLGAAALGRHVLSHRPGDDGAEALGFDRPMANSLDAVSDRDFALEFLSVASICAMHLSRWPKNW